MRRERESFTPEEELKINKVAFLLREQGEVAMDRLRDTRNDYGILEYKILREGGSIQDARAAAGRTFVMASEAISRAQGILKEKGEDRVSLLAEIIKKTKKKK